MQNIALTSLYKDRIETIKKSGIKNKKFNPDSIDITKTFTFFQKDNKRFTDENLGFMRLLENPSFVKSQENWLRKKLKENLNLQNRFLIRFPDEFSDYDKLRDIFLEIQEKAGMKRFYVFFGISESETSIFKYVKNLDKEKKYTLVLDMSMKFEVLKPIVEKYIDSFEIIFLYRNWNEFKENFAFVIRQAQKNQDVLHMAFVPVDINAYGNKNIFSTALICNGFKSISLVDTEFKKFFFKWKNPRRVKSHQEKADETRWVNEKVMSYDDKHNPNCFCFGKDKTAKQVMKDCGIKEAVTYHDLEVLSEVYSKAKVNQKFKEELLNLESIKSILVSLKLQ
jgi:hypothetical protein